MRLEMFCVLGCATKTSLNSMRVIFSSGDARPRSGKSAPLTFASAVNVCVHFACAQFHPDKCSASSRLFLSFGGARLESVIFSKHRRCCAVALGMSEGQSKVNQSADTTSSNDTRGFGKRCDLTSPAALEIAVATPTPCHPPNAGSEG